MVDQRRATAIDQLFGRSHRILLSPIPQERPRLHGLRMYDPLAAQKTIVGRWVYEYLNTYYDVTQDMLPLTTSYVSIDVTFLISRPLCHFVGGDRNNGVRQQYESAMPTTTGDIDNYVKFFLDAIDGIFYSNDRNVVQIRALKLYCNSNRGSTVFKIHQYEVDAILVDDDEF